MDVSQRVLLIEQVAIKLASYGWNHLNMVLRNHGYSSAMQLSGNTKFEEAIHALEFKGDENLINIATTLKIDLGINTNVNSQVWINGFYKIFISHLDKDKVLAKEIKEELGRYAISCFVAHEDIEPTKSWQTEIELALNTCDCLLALLTKDFGESKWTDQEVGFAYGRNKLIIPIRMGVDPYGFIGRFQAMKYYSSDRLASEIFSSLLQNEKTRQVYSSALMSQFERSGYFREAKRNFALLEKIPKWSEELISRYYIARKINGQISDAIGVPSSIDYLVKRSNALV